MLAFMPLGMKRSRATELLCYAYASSNACWRCVVREGLVHVSELDVTRVENPEALFQVPCLS